MIRLFSPTGGVYHYNPDTDEVYKNGEKVGKEVAEPVFCGNGKNHLPMFAGLYIVANDSVLTLAGNMKKVVEFNSIK
jgi:hypothetical protein